MQHFHDKPWITKKLAGKYFQHHNLNLNVEQI